MRLVDGFKKYRKVTKFIVDVIAIVVLIVILKFIVNSILGYFRSPDKDLITFIFYLRQSINEKAILYMGPFIIILIVDRAWSALKEAWAYIKRKAS